MKAKDKIKTATLPAFDVADYVDDDKTMAEYLSAVIEANDPGLRASSPPRLATWPGRAG